jgi:hypothetical protein
MALPMMRFICPNFRVFFATPILAAACCGCGCSVAITFWWSVEAKSSSWSGETAGPGVVSSRLFRVAQAGCHRTRAKLGKPCRSRAAPRYPFVYSLRVPNTAASSHVQPARSTPSCTRCSLFCALYGLHTVAQGRIPFPARST